MQVVNVNFVLNRCGTELVRRAIALDPVIDEAIRRIRKSGKAPGILTPNEADARHWLQCGALFVAVGADVGILARGAEALAAKFKS